MTHTSTKRQFEEIVDDEIKTKNKVRQIEKNLMVELTARQPWWYRVYWLDEFTTCPLVDYGIDRLKLRGIIDYLQTYTSVDQLLGDIQRFEENNEKIIILLTISNILDSFYQLDQFSQIHSIYIYALSSEENTIIGKINTHAKVRGISHEASVLINKVSHNLRQLESSPLMFQNTKSNKKEFTTAPYLMNKRRPSEDWFNTLLNILQENQPSSNGKDIFLKYCRELYTNEPRILHTINEFDLTYTAEQAIRWYTREGFAYRLLNQALRQKDQNLIILLHFFIFDLEHQLLKQLTESEFVHFEVYRGQLMSMEEINLIIRKIDRTMFLCSFLSTTTDLEVAMMFSGAGSYTQDSPIQPVIFHIKYDTFQPTRGVANIQHISFSQDEDEILFSPLHILNPINVFYDEDTNAYRVKCDVSGDRYDIRIDLDQRLIELDILLRILIQSEANSDLNNHEQCIQLTKDVILLRQELIFPQISNATLETIDSRETSCHRFQLDILRSFHNNSLDHRPLIRNDIAAALYDCLATLYKCKGQFECALKYYEKAANYDQDNVRTKFTRKINTAQTHKMMGNFDIAWRMREELFEEMVGGIEDQLHQSITFATPFLENDYNLDIWFRKIYDYLEYIRKNVPLNVHKPDDEQDDSDDEWIEPENSLSEDYGLLGRYFWYKAHDSEYALLCYQQEMELTKCRINNNEKNLGEIYHRMADVYKEVDNEKALEYYHDVIEIFSGYEESYSVELAVCWCNIAQFRNENYLDCFQRAFDLLVKRTSEIIYDLQTESFGECYFYLAKKFFHDPSFNQRQMILKWSEQALRFYLMDDYDQSDRQIDIYVQFLLTILSDENTTDTYTKEQLIEKWSPNEKHCPLLTNHQIQQMLQETIDTLSSLSFI